MIHDTSMVESDTSGNGLGLYPLRRSKTLHLVRHAQGLHNLEEAAHSKTSPEFLDAALSPLGWNQTENLREHVDSVGLLKRIQLVIVSPLLRTMQTAAGVFGGETVKEEEDTPQIPLMVAQVNSPGRGAVSTPNYPPFIAVELCRERMGVNTCDKRRGVSEYKTWFPALDFSLVETDDDTWWTPDVRESDEDLAARGLKFFDWLWTREEKEIAIVTHSAFLFHTLHKFGNDCHESVKSEMHEFMKGSGCAKTNYPGGIPIAIGSYRASE